MIRFICLLLATAVISCATSFQLLSEPDRELLIHPDRPGLGFPYVGRECKKKFLGIKICKKKRKEVFYDFTKKEVREKLINMGFSCRSPRAWR